MQKTKQKLKPKPKCTSAEVHVSLLGEWSLTHQSNLSQPIQFHAALSLWFVPPPPPHPTPKKNPDDSLTENSAKKQVIAM